MDGAATTQIGYIHSHFFQRSVSLKIPSQQIGVRAIFPANTIYPFASDSGLYSKMLHAFEHSFSAYFPSRILKNSMCRSSISKARTNRVDGTAEFTDAFLLLFPAVKHTPPATPKIVSSTRYSGQLAKGLSRKTLPKSFNAVKFDPLQRFFRDDPSPLR